MQYKLSQCLVDLFASKFVKTHQHNKLLRQFLLICYAENNEIFFRFQLWFFFGNTAYTISCDEGH